MLTCMKPRLLWLQKSNDSTWGIGVELGATGPGLTSTSPEEEQDKGTAKGYQNWSSRALGTENKRSRFLSVVEQIQGIMYRQGYGWM